MSNRTILILAMLGISAIPEVKSSNVRVDTRNWRRYERKRYKKPRRTRRRKPVIFGKRDTPISRRKT